MRVGNVWKLTYDRDVCYQSCQCVIFNESRFIISTKKILFETKISASGRKYSSTKVINELDVTWMVSFSQKRAKRSIYELERVLEKKEAMLKTLSKLKQSQDFFKSLIQIPKGNEAPSLRTDKLQDAKK